VSSEIKQAVDPEVGEQAKKKSPRVKKKKRRLRELIECLLVAGLLALGIRQYGFMLFKIPTRSMEPTLYGNEAYGDRVLAMMWYDRGRLGLGLGELRRWQVIVFRHHDEHKRATNFIKRLVGLPGERLEIRDGDIWVASPGSDKPEIVRKDLEVQKAFWIKLCQLDFSNPQLLRYYWSVPGAEAPGRLEKLVHDGRLFLSTPKTPGGELNVYWRQSRPLDNRFIRTTIKQVECPNDCGKFRAVFDTARPIVLCPKCGGHGKPGNPERGAVWGVYDNGVEGAVPRDGQGHKGQFWTETSTGGGSSIGDLRLAFDFENLAGQGRLQLSLISRTEVFKFDLPLNSEQPMARLSGPKKIDLREKVKLGPGVHRLEMIHLDGEFMVSIDGRYVGRCPYSPNTRNGTSSDLRISLFDGAQIAIDNLSLDRDIYYIAHTGHDEVHMSGDRRCWVEIPAATDKKEGRYFFLGDNPLASQDGRYFGTKPESAIVARGLMVVWPASRFHCID
jgi:signal peptidase I